MQKADFDPSKERKDMTIRKLCEDIEDGNIVLPVFQTYIRWTKEKAKELFNYQLFGKAPVAPISINLIDNPKQVIDQIGFLDRRLLDKADLVGKFSVADGQQRLSANYKAYINDPEFKNIVLDLNKNSFIEIDMNIQSEPLSHQIPVGILYNKEQSVFLDYVNSKPSLKKDDVKDVLSTIRKKHQNYYYVVNFASNMSKAEQMEWFEVLNLAGTQVTAAMVYLTDLLVKGVDFYTEYAIPSDVKPKLIGKANISDIRKMIELTLKALDDTLNFIATTPKVVNPQRIDVITYLVGLFTENDISKMNDKQKTFLIQWINNVDFINNSNKLRRQKYIDLRMDYNLANVN